MSDGRPFMPAWLDDLSLPGDTLKVLLHMWRRGDCWESRANMAKHCKIGVRKLDRITRQLLVMGLVSRERRMGESCVYSTLVKQGEGVVSETSTPPPVSETNTSVQTEHWGSAQVEHWAVSETDTGECSKRTLKGTPLKAIQQGTPLKEIPEGLSRSEIYLLKFPDTPQSVMQDMIDQGVL